MANVNDIIKNILNETLLKRLDTIEGRFTREGIDLNQLKLSADQLKKILKECEVRNEENTRLALAAEAELKEKESKSKLATSRTNTEGNLSKTTSSSFKRDKSTGRSLVKDKSVGKNLGKVEDKGLSRVKTVTNLKKTEELKTPLNKNKSVSRIKTEDSLKTMPKTPKIEKKTNTLTSSPERSNKMKIMNRTPTHGNLKEDNQKNMKRTPTAKSLKEDPIKEKALDKNHTAKGNLSKSNTKPNLQKKQASDKNVNLDKAIVIEETITKQNITSRDEPILIQPNHPKRHENISMTIGVENHINEELLTKEEPIIIPEDKTELVELNEVIINSNKLDFAEILDDRWSAFSKYWNRFDHVKFLEVNKTLFGKLSIIQLIAELQKEILENETKIKALRDKNTPEDLVKEQNPFALTRGALKAIELLNDTLYVKLFTEGHLPTEDIILTYRIFFQLLNKQEFVKIKNVNEFWKKTCDFFVNDTNPKLGTMIQNLVKEIDFSIENIYRLVRLVGNNVTKISPNYFSKLCGTTGLFIFLIKDAFDYAGILIDKRTSSARLYKNYMFNFEMLQTKIEKLKKIQTIYFS